jgi:hypothetical protein
MVFIRHVYKYILKNLHSTHRVCVPRLILTIKSGNFPSRINLLVFLVGP